MKKIVILQLIQKGVTMVEMMLVLSIIGVLLLLATRYYQTTHSSSLITTTLESIQAIYVAEQQYCDDNDCNDIRSKPNLDMLIKNGLLPKNFITYANPWGTITDHDFSTYNPFTVTFSNVPQQSCTNLKQKITTTYGAAGEIQVKIDCEKESSMKIDFY